MDKLDSMVSEIADYCNKNRIEFIFACTKDNNKQNILAYHLDNSVVLKKALTILDTLIRK